MILTKSQLRNIIRETIKEEKEKVMTSREEKNLYEAIRVYVSDIADRLGISPQDLKSDVMDRVHDWFETTASDTAMSALKDAAATAAMKKSSVGRGEGTDVDVQEDKDFQVEWDTEYAFKVTIRGGRGQKEQWHVVGDIDTGKVEVVGRV